MTIAIAILFIFFIAPLFLKIKYKTSYGPKVDLPNGEYEQSGESKWWVSFNNPFAE